MALDSLQGIKDVSKLFPKFVRDELKNEYSTSLCKIWEYLHENTVVLAQNNGKFMHLTRLLSLLPEAALPTYEDKKKLVLTLWDLYCCPELRGSRRCRLADILITQLRHLTESHIPALWMTSDAQSSYVSSQAIQELGHLLNWEYLFSEIEARYRRGYRGSVGISCAKRKQGVTSATRLAMTCRKLWDSEIIGEKLQEILNLNEMDGANVFIFYKSRILLLFVGHQFWHQAVISQQLIRWWSLLSGRTSQTWDATFSCFLFRAVKFGWATGSPLNQHCLKLLLFLFQLISACMLLPSTQPSSVSFIKDNVPGEYTPLLPKHLNILRKLAKTLALLLEPLNGPIDFQAKLLSQERYIKKDSMSHKKHMHDPYQLIPFSVWDYLETLISVILPLTHPSHNGKWIQPISQFVNAFILAYCRRIGRERMSSAVVSEATGRLCDKENNSQLTYSYRLGKKEDEKIIELFKPLLLQGMYSKSITAATAYETCIKRLAHIATPNNLMDDVLYQIQSAFESVTEPHQIQSGLRLLSQLSPIILLRYPDQLGCLLTLTRTHMDGGDPFKTVQVLTFYTVILSQISCYDMSDICVYDLPIEAMISKVHIRYFFPEPHESSPFISWYHYPKETLSFGRIDQQEQLGNSHQKKHLDYNIDYSNEFKDFWSPQHVIDRFASVQMTGVVINTWAEYIFNQLLELCQHSVKLEKHSAGLMTSVDRTFEVAMKFCLSFLLNECDESLYSHLCQLYLNWLTVVLLPDVIKFASLICRVFAQSRPDLCLKLLFHPIKQRFFTPLKEQSESHITPGSTEELSIIWYMSCFSSLLRAGGQPLIPYHHDIIEIIIWALGYHNKRIATLGIKCLRRAIESTTIISAEPGGSLGYNQRQNMTEKAWSTMRWGHIWWIQHEDYLSSLGCKTSVNDNQRLEKFINDDIQIKWSIPREHDLEFINYLTLIGIKYMIELLRYCIPHSNTEQTIEHTHQSISFDSLLSLSNEFIESIGPNNNSLFNLNIIQHITLSTAMLQQPQTKLLYRALSIGRHLLKAITPLCPDEKNHITSGAPIISPLNTSLGKYVSIFLANICLAICRFHLGLMVDKTETFVHSVPALIELRGTEDGVIIKKVLKAMDQVLVRRWCAGGLQAQTASNGKLWHSFSNWCSVTTGVHHLSEYQDMSRSSWSERLLHQWMLRIEARRMGQEFIGYRRDLIILVARFGTHYYAENRTLAQDILKDAFRCHYGARTHIVNMLLQELSKETSRLSTRNQMCETPEGGGLSQRLNLNIPLHSDSSPNLTTFVNEDNHSDMLTTNIINKTMCHSKISQDSSNVELCYARITGVMYCLNNSAMLSRVWCSAFILQTTLRAICDSFKAPIARDKLQSRLVSLAHGILSHREELPRDSNFDTYIVQGLLSNILNELNSGKTQHWRFQLVATAILTSFNSEPVPMIEEEYVHWLLSSCNRSTYSPLLNTLSIFSLTLYLHYKLHHMKESALSSSIVERLQHINTIRMIAEALVHSHHESCRATVAAYPETAYQLVVDIVKIDSTWPTTRPARLSRHLSLHNCLAIQTFIEAQYMFKTDSNDVQFISHWANEIERFLAFPSGESEYHVAACEMIAGILRASNIWDMNSRTFTWKLLYPQIASAFHSFDHERFLDFLDGIRFGLDGLSLLHQDEFYYPFLNLGLAIDQLPHMTWSTQTMMNFDQEITKSSLEDTKRLKLFSVIIQESHTSCPKCLLQFIPAMSQLLCHPYKQIRHELARCVATLFWLCSFRDSQLTELKELTSSISSILIKSATQYHAFLRVHGADEVTRDLSDRRPAELCGAETIILIVILLFRHYQDTIAYYEITKICPLLFEAVKHPEFDISEMAWTALSYISVGIFGIGSSSTCNDDHTQRMGYTDFISQFMLQLEDQLDSNSWKVRTTVIRLAESLGNRQRLGLHQTSEYKKLLNICVKGLTDTHSEVRTQARQALSNLILSLSSEDCKAYTHVFLKMAGRPGASNSSSNDTTVMGGVLGLTALVHSAPYHIPDWLPETITQLAQYGTSKSSDIVKRHVQQTLQEFLRTHQDAWRQVHSKKFSEAQLDILETYKGRPIYFS